jgi:dTDP-4-amino-4,6-dideoxygalactose transaminase
MLTKLHSRGIGAAAYYPIPIHKIPIYKTRPSLPNTDWASRSVLSLPVHPRVSGKDIEFIGRAVREIADG